MGLEPDPIAWIRELGREAPWEYDLLEAFLRAYLRADRRGRQEARRALPGIDDELAMRRALRSELRRN